MQLNIHQSSLTQAVASNRPAGATSVLPAQAARPVIELDASDTQVDNQVADIVTHDSTQNLQSRLGAQLEYERNTQGHQGQGAIAQYLQTQHAAKREEIQQMVGVDLYA